MTQIFKKCKNCNEIMTIYSENITTICKNCEQEYDTKSLLSIVDKKFLKKINNPNIENSLMYNSHIIQGNNHISNEQFVEAEKSFKLAISLDENRYEGYYGVTRAKTHDFQILPTETDYLEYAKLALDKADDDIDQKIKANLAKLNIYK